MQWPKLVLKNPHQGNFFEKISHEAVISDLSGTLGSNAYFHVEMLMYKTCGCCLEQESEF